MDAGIFTTGLHVAGVPIGNDEWVQQCVQAKAAAVQIDVGKLDIIHLTVHILSDAALRPEHSSYFSWA